MGIWSIRKAEQELPGNDPGEIVIDEFCGFYAASLGFSSWNDPVIAVVTALLFFRLFDVLKPGPIGCAERVPGAWGIMLDDLLAGVCANLSVRLVFWGAKYWGYYI